MNLKRNFNHKFCSYTRIDGPSMIKALDLYIIKFVSSSQYLIKYYLVALIYTMNTYFNIYEMYLSELIPSSFHSLLCIECSSSTLTYTLIPVLMRYKMAIIQLGLLLCDSL